MANKMQPRHIYFRQSDQHSIKILERYFPAKKVLIRHRIYLPLVGFLVKNLIPVQKLILYNVTRNQISFDVIRGTMITNTITKSFKRNTMKLYFILKDIGTFKDRSSSNLQLPAQEIMAVSLIMIMNFILVVLCIYYNLTSNVYCQ